jgi:hypothetical protein
MARHHVILYDEYDETYVRSFRTLRAALVYCMENPAGAARENPDVRWALSVQAVEYDWRGTPAWKILETEDGIPSRCWWFTPQGLATSPLPSAAPSPGGTSPPRP